MFAPKLTRRLIAFACAAVLLSACGEGPTGPTGGDDPQAPPTALPPPGTPPALPGG